MKAYYSTKYGGPEFAFYGDLPDSIAKPGEVLVRIEAVSINPVDYKVMSGALRIVTGLKFPKIFGTDFAGIVKEITDGVTDFKKGDRIYGSATIIFGKHGALAELISVLPQKIRLIPEGMSFKEAASLPVAALTALNGIRRCKVKENSKVLINGATGGVGHFAVQIAKDLGAQVIASCSSENAELAQQLGAEKVINYMNEELRNEGSDFDAIMDAYGKMNYTTIIKLLKKGGIYASTLFFPPAQIKAAITKILYGKIMTSANMRAKSEDYEEIERLWREKKLIPLIDSTFSLSKCGDAFYHAEHGKPRGKVVVTV
ncbi:MAG TPA: NAD(P)-dependent alcohol dehydrogenase [Bacteroidales bacterium]|nr:NAD(P)-dependent alcohol dehydrogenase [Bacteroidales bacterium]